MRSGEISRTACADYLSGNRARGCQKAVLHFSKRTRDRLMIAAESGPLVLRSMLLHCDANHPANAEAIGEHAEARRPESLAQRHSHLATVGQGCERAIGLGFMRHRERERKTVELRLVVACAV